MWEWVDENEEEAIPFFGLEFRAVRSIGLSSIVEREGRREKGRKGSNEGIERVIE